jgi:hypothetical protein
VHTEKLSGQFVSRTIHIFQFRDNSNSGSYQNWLVVELSRSIPPIDTIEFKNMLILNLQILVRSEKSNLLTKEVAPEFKQRRHRWICN